MFEVDYKISLYPSNYCGYQSKNKNIGKIVCYVSSIWKYVKENFETELIRFTMFNIMLNYTLTIERYCLEKGFQRIRIKGGACSPCCMEKSTDFTISYLFHIKFGDD